MKESGRPVKKRKTPWLLGLFVLFSLTILVFLQSSNVWKTFTVETASDTLLLYALSSLNFFAFIIFGFILLRSILKLARERRALQLGSRIKTRLFAYFAAISLLPIIAMAAFSYLFMNRAIERWFSQIPENVLVEARDGAIAEYGARLQETARMLAGSIGDLPPASANLRELASAGNLAYIEIRSAQGETLATGGPPLSDEARTSLNETLARARSDASPGVFIGPTEGFDAAYAQMTEGRRLIIIPDRRSGDSVRRMVEGSLVEFDRLKDQQITVRQLGFLTLGVLTFLLIFASSWTAIYVARGLTVPIKALAEGAERIAQGDLGHRVDVIAEDELDLLIMAFNQMSSRLEENSSELNARKRYIETVLQSLPTGVISFDSEDRISTINRAARSMFRLENADFRGLELGTIVSGENRVIIERLINRARRVGRASEQTTLSRETVGLSRDAAGEITVAMTATALENDGGAVVVIEDLSELITAQRASAWQEVARRMAHEIKNPLTPIQLSAERIAKRFSDTNTNGSGDDIHTTEGQTVRVIQDGTSTIIREVQSLKTMVDEFSRFARLPNAKPEPGDLNDIVRQVVAMYEDRKDAAAVVADLASALPETMLDTEQIKRVFVNLIENSLEAFETRDDENIIQITTRHDAARDLVVAEVTDNGKGIPPADIQRLFQPYFSTKGRGTGLGLAIVQRIVSEHGGKINAAANQPKGARFIIELPIVYAVT